MCSRFSHMRLHCHPKHLRFKLAVQTNRSNGYYKLNGRWYVRCYVVSSLWRICDGKITCFVSDYVRLYCYSEVVIFIEASAIYAEIASWCFQIRQARRNFMSV